jgi:ATP-dependent helicase HepA
MAAVSYWQKSAGALLVSSVLMPPENVEPGLYVFVCDLWQYVCAHHETRLVGAVWSVDKRVVIPELSKSLIRHIGALAENRTFQLIDRAKVEAAITGLDTELDARRREELERIVSVNELITARRRASVSSFFTRRVQRLEADLAQVKESKIKRMKESELTRINREFEEKLRQLDNAADCDITTKRIAAGVIEVTAEKADG